MPVILRIIMIRFSPLHYKQAMWSGLRPTAKKIHGIQDGEIMVKNVCVTDGIR